MEDQAREFITSLYQWQLKSCRRRNIIAAICGVFGCAGIGTIMAGHYRLLHAPDWVFQIAFLCCGGAIACPAFFFLHPRYLLHELRTDASTYSLHTVSGRYHRAFVQTRTDPRGGQGVPSAGRIKIGDVSLLVPIQLFRTMPDSGEANFTFFANSHYIWSCEGQPVWPRGEYAFWK